MHLPRLLVCSAALVFCLCSTMSFADDGSEDADEAPAKTAHHAKHKPAAKTSDSKPVDPDCSQADREAGKCLDPVRTPVKGPGH